MGWAGVTSPPLAPWRHPDLLPPPQDTRSLDGRVSDSGHHAVGSELENGIKPWRSTPTCGRTWWEPEGGVSLQSLRSGWPSWQRWPHSPLCRLGHHSIPSSPFVQVSWSVCSSPSQEILLLSFTLLFLPWVSSCSMHNGQGIRVMLLPPRCG